MFRFIINYTNINPYIYICVCVCVCIPSTGDRLIARPSAYISENKNDKTWHIAMTSDREREKPAVQLSKKSKSVGTVEQAASVFGRTSIVSLRQKS
jgi:DsbC/DsbD-like thiol-disulfide interchange protein